MGVQILSDGPNSMYKINAPRIKEAITPDGLAGFDELGQLWVWTPKIKEEDDYQTGSIYRDVRHCKCYICNKSWELTSESLKDQYYDQSGRLMHMTCLQGVNKLQAHQDIQEALIDAGYLFSMLEVPPRYPHSTPWQIVTVLANEGNKRPDTGVRIVLGRRKRVWEIRFHGCTAALGTELFDHVTDTKGWQQESQEDSEYGKYYYVHAYTKADMVKYLEAFRKSIPFVTARYA
jgi:hypothetical protein